MGRLNLGTNVFDAAVERLTSLYRDNARVVVACSGGKDSTCCLELAVLAARATNRLPVEAFFVDEEVSIPGTAEFIERTMQRPDVSLRVFVRSAYWFVNAFARSQPFYKAFDPAAKDRWLRQPFPNSEDAKYRDLSNIVDIETYPWNWEAVDMVKVVGLRAQESPRRSLAIHSSKGHLTQPNPTTQVISCRPIYDWTDGDVWLAIKKFGWDYNRAYDALYKANVRRKEIRIAPPVLGPQSLHVLTAARKIWPDWFERLCNRLDGVRRVVIHGKDTLTPKCKHGESWKQCFRRLCLKSPIPWIAKRARQAMDTALKNHAQHSTLPFPEVIPCLLCSGDKTLGSWKRLTIALYNGDPICMKTAPLGLKPLDPEKFVSHERKELK